MSQDSDPAKELALRTTDVIELGEGTRVLPVTEADPIMVGATTKIKDDTEDDQSGNSDNLDGAGGSAISPKAGLNIMKRELTQR